MLTILFISSAFAEGPEESTHTQSIPAYIHTWDCQYSAPIVNRRIGGFQASKSKGTVKVLDCRSNETNYTICKKLHTFNSDILKENKGKDALIIYEHARLEEKLEDKDMGICTYRIQYIASDQLTPKKYGFKALPNMDIYKETIK